MRTSTPSTRTASTRAALCIALSALLPACSGSGSASDDPATDSAQSAVTASGGDSEMATMSADLIAAGDLSSDGGTSLDAQLTASIEARAEVVFTDPSCVTVAPGASDLTVTFASCTTVRGGLPVDGAIHASVALDASGASYSLGADAITVGSTTLAGSWNLTAPAAGAGSDGDYAWSGSFDVQGPLGGEVSGNSDAGWTTADSCVTYSGSLELDGRLASTQVQVSNMVRCGGMCPLSGSGQLSSSARGTMTWTYDGSDVVSVTGQAGNTIDIDLDCQAN